MLVMAWQWQMTARGSFMLIPIFVGESMIRGSNHSPLAVEGQPRVQTPDYTSDFFPSARLSKCE